MNPRFTPARRRERSDRGVAAIEAGLVTTILMPLMLGVLAYGQAFWELQTVPDLAARVPFGQVQGSLLTCQELVDRVEATVVENVNNLSNAGPIDAGDVTVTVLEVLPMVGAVVRTETLVQVDSAFSAVLPNDGYVETGTTARVDNVTLSVPSC